jgi:hypothetical protein
VLALGGSNGTVALLDACAWFAPLCELRPALAKRVAGAVLSSLTPAWAPHADIACLRAATLRGRRALLALHVDGTLRAWDVSAGALRKPSPLLSSSLPPPPLGDDAGAAPLPSGMLFEEPAPDADDVALIVHVHPPGWPAAGRLLAYRLHMPPGGGLGAPAFVSELAGGAGAPPSDAAAARGEVWALWSFGGGGAGGAGAAAAAAPPRMLRWRLAAPGAPAAVALSEEPLAALSAAWSFDGSAGGAACAAALLRAHGAGALSPGGALEARLLAQLTRRGVLSRAALEATLADAGAPPGAVAAAAGDARALLAVAAELLAAAAAGGAASSSSAAAAAASAGGGGATAACISAFSSLFCRAYAARWRDAHPPLGLLLGASGGATAVAGVLRRGAAALLLARPGEGCSTGAGADCDAFLAVAAEAARALGPAACDALDELRLAGHDALCGPLPSAVAFLRAGTPGGAAAACAASSSAAADDATRAAAAAARAALRLVNSRIVVALRALRDPAAAAEAALAALERGAVGGAIAHSPHHAPALPAAAAAAQALGGGALAAAAASGAARHVAAAALDAARGVSLLLCYVAEGRSQCGVSADVSAALVALRPRAEAAVHAALLAHWAASSPAQRPPFDDGGAGAAAAAHAHARLVAPPPVVTTTPALFTAFRARRAAGGGGGGDALPAPLPAALAAAGDRLVSFVRRGAHDAAAAPHAAAPPCFAARAAALGGELYGDAQLHALAELLRLATCAAPPDDDFTYAAAAAAATAAASGSVAPPPPPPPSPRPVLLFLEALTHCARMVDASRRASAGGAGAESAAAERAAALDAACALFFRAGVGVDTGDPALGALLADFRKRLGGTAAEHDGFDADDDAVGASRFGGPAAKLRYYTSLMLCFELLSAPGGAARFARAAVRVAPLAFSRAAAGGAADAQGGGVAARELRAGAAPALAACRDRLWASACAYEAARRAWRDAYAALLNVASPTHRARLARGLVAEACGAGAGGALLALPWTGDALASCVDAALSGHAAFADPMPPHTPAHELLFALRTQRGDHAGAAAALLLAARRLATRPGRAALRVRATALLRAANSLRLAPPEARYVAEPLPGADPATWPEGTGHVPTRPAPPPALAAPTDAGMSASQLGYGSDDDDVAVDEDRARLSRLHLSGGGEEAMDADADADAQQGLPPPPACEPADVVSGAEAARALARLPRPVRLVTLADIEAEYALLTARMELPAALADALPASVSTAAADAAVGALLRAAQFGPAAALAAAWHRRDGAPGARAAALARVAAALATHAVTLASEEAAERRRAAAAAAGVFTAPPPRAFAEPPRSALGDRLGREGGAAGERRADAAAVWRALRALLSAHDAACCGALRYAAADAALAANPRAALPPWLVDAFTPRTAAVIAGTTFADFADSDVGAHGAGGGMARRAGADPAALLRLYLAHGALGDAASLALAELEGWADRATAPERCRPSAAWFAYGALDALRAALAAAAAAGDAGARASGEALDGALARHAARAVADSQNLVALHARAREEEAAPQPMH